MVTKPKKKGVPGDVPVKSKRRASKADVPAKSKKRTSKAADPIKSKKRVSKADESGKPVVVRLAESITVDGIKSMYVELSQYLSGSGTLSIDASSVQTVDTAGIQLLLAFTREIAKQDRLVEWQSPSSELLQVVELLDVKELGL